MRKKKVNNTKRSKCNVCGKVRYQDYMTKITPFNKVVNGDVWICSHKYTYIIDGSYIQSECAKQFLNSQLSMINKMQNIYNFNKLSLFK
jgi:NADH dehydrogenase/NADH:ubiquinone oxidoreductase subunit G